MRLLENIIFELIFCLHCVILLQGGSESWLTESNSAIASLAFHPTAQLLLIATNNEVHLWDWSRKEPFTVVKTASETERVRYIVHHKSHSIHTRTGHINVAHGNIY